MHRSMIRFVLLLLTLAATSIALAQNAAPVNGPPHSLVSIYRIATGKQAEFLKWMAARDAVDKEAGITQAQWYAHLDGDSWDYLVVGPSNTPEQDKKIEAAMKKHGLTTGFKQNLEVRQFIASHTDTFTVGPVSVSEMADWAAAK